MRLTQLVLLASVVVTTTMCGGSGGDTTTAPGGSTGNGGNPYGDPGTANSACTPGTGTVCLTTSNTYNPSTLTVTKGATVTWSNTTGVLHTVTFTTPGVASDSTTFSSGTKTMTFPAAGSFQYHCLIHGLVMSGTVIVQ